jgi:hypothetical protein
LFDICGSEKMKTGRTTATALIFTTSLLILQVNAQQSSSPPNLAKSLPSQTAGNSDSTSDISSLSVSPTGHGSAIGKSGTEIANFDVARKGSNVTLKLNIGRGRVIDFNMDITRDDSGKVYVKGTVDRVPFQTVYSNEGRLIEGAPPKNISGQDLDVISQLREVTVLKMPVPKAITAPITRPSPTVPTQGRAASEKEHVTAANGVGEAQPEFSAGGCAIAYVEIVFSAATGALPGVFFGAAGLWFGCFR